MVRTELGYEGFRVLVLGKEVYMFRASRVRGSKFRQYVRDNTLLLTILSVGLSFILG